MSLAAGTQASRKPPPAGFPRRRPATSQKRLGDGFYEQRLIAEQVGQLTGRRFLAGYSNDEAQYQALMDAGVSVAQAWAIRPGIALSAEQMAQLTTDIVLLVEKDVHLADGTTQKVLVPQVYARLQSGDLTPSGALLAANSIDLQVGGDLTTSGSIAGRQIVSLSAENLQNLRGRIAGQSVGVAARNDLTLDGGTISAQDRLIAAAGNNLTVQSSTTDLAVRMSGTPSFVNSRVVDRVAGLYVSAPDALLVASAGNDLKILGGIVQNSGTVTAAGGGGSALVAGNNLTLGTVLEASNSYAQAKNSWRKEQKTSEVGSLIQTTGDLTLIAGNDLAARAASVASGGALTAQAGNDLNITAGEASTDMASYRKIKKSGFASSTTKINRDAEQSTRALSSLFSGERVTLAAGQDVLLRGSAVSAQGDLAISAARDITLDSAQDTLQETHFRSIKKSGFSMSSLGAISYGNSALTQNAAGQSVTQVGSTLSGTNVTTASGRDTTIKASTVIADNDITLLAGRNVDLLAAANAQNVETQTKSSSTTIGLTTDLSGRITNFGKTKASEDVTGTAISQSTSLLSANAGDLTIRAGLDAQHKGSGHGNITTQGADLLAGQTIVMSGNAIDLQAVENQSTSHSLAKTSSFTIGARPAGFWGEKIAAIGDAVERAQNTDNDRLKGALALKAGYDAWKLYQGQKPPTIVPTGTETSPGSGTADVAAAPLKSNSGGTVPGASTGTDTSTKPTGSGLATIHSPC